MAEYMTVLGATFYSDHICWHVSNHLRPGLVVTQAMRVLRYVVIIANKYLLFCPIFTHSHLNSCTKNSDILNDQSWALIFLFYLQNALLVVFNQMCHASWCMIHAKAKVFLFVFLVMDILHLFRQNNWEIYIRLLSLRVGESGVSWATR